MAEISALKTNGTCTKSSSSSRSDDGMITAAEMIRQKQQIQQPQNNQSALQLESTTSVTAVTTATIPSRNTTKSSINDIDDEIQRLERELQQQDNDDDADDDDDDDSDNDSDDFKIEEDDNGDDKYKETMIVSISESNQNPIEKLPTHCLPPSVTRMSKVKSGSKKRPRNDDTNDNNHHISGTGLKKAVQELLHNYQGRNSTERIPYFCRY